MLKVTIGLPTYNRKDYLKIAIDSVLRQDYPNIELLISDNHSTDGTKEMVENIVQNKVNLKYKYHSQNYGGKKNWHYCWKNATGTLFLMLSDDDVLLPGAITNLVNAMIDSVGLVIGNEIYIDAHGNETGHSKNPAGIVDDYQHWKGRLIKGYSEEPSSVMYRIELARKYIDSITVLETTGDLGLSLMISSEMEVNYISDFVAQYRVHNGNDTKNILKCVTSHLDLVKCMKKNNISHGKYNMIFKYCKKTTRGYMKRTVKNRDFSLWKKVTYILVNNYFKYYFLGCLYALFYTAIYIFKSILKIFLYNMKLIKSK